MLRTGFHRIGCLISATTLIVLATLGNALAQDGDKQRAPDIERSVAPDGLLSQLELRQRAEDRSAGRDRETVTRKRLAHELMSRDPDITGSIQRSASAIRSAVVTPVPSRSIME